MPRVTRVPVQPVLVDRVSATAPEVARHLEHVMELVEIETAFGTVAAGEQALVDAIKGLLLAEHDAPTPDDPTPDEPRASS